MLNKKKDKLLGKCPFRNLKECSKECVLFREGIRFNDKTNEQYPVADCALNIIADNLEAVHNRSYMLQKEVGETKNVMALKILSEMGYSQNQQVVNAAVNIIKPTLENKSDKVKELE
jgi:hypothetical protein